MARITCEICGGTGSLGDPLVECGQCRGVGTYETDWVGVIRQLELKLPGTNVFWSYQIWEATDLTEFTALSAGNKDAYRGIVRMGTVSLVEDSHSRDTLWDLFDSESTTRAALLALIT